MSGWPIVTFSSIDWSAVWQGHQEVMTRLAAAGHPVLFVENTGVRRPRLSDIPRILSRAAHLARQAGAPQHPAPGVEVLAPRVVPLPYWRPAVRLNQRLLEGPLRAWSARQEQRPIVWTYLPTPLVGALAQALAPPLLVYYCVDDLPASSALARPSAASEADLLRAADLVFVTAEALRQKALKYRADVHLIPSGVDYERFVAARESAADAPLDIRRLPRPLVGYVGGPHRWFDDSLLAGIARALPHVHFACIGPLPQGVSSPASPANVHWLGPKPHNAIPAYLRDLDAAIIPYVLDEYTKSVFPTKLNEYLAMGLPVVATPLPEIVAFNERHGGILSIAADPESFAAALMRALEPPSAAARDVRLAVARSQDWSVRVEQMQQLVDAALERRGRSGRPGSGRPRA